MSFTQALIDPVTWDTLWQLWPLFVTILAGYSILLLFYLILRPEHPKYAHPTHNIRRTHQYAAPLQPSPASNRPDVSRTNVLYKARSAPTSPPTATTTGTVAFRATSRYNAPEYATDNYTHRPSSNNLRLRGQ